MQQEPPQELIEFLAPYSQPVVELFLAARSLVYAAAPGATEYVNDAPYTVSTCYTYTHSYVLGFIHIAAATRHVNLGFDYGVTLIDALDRLQGEGKRVRHLPIRSVDDLSDSYLIDLVKQAENAAHRPAEEREANTIVVRMRGAKKRPVP